MLSPRQIKLLRRGATSKYIGLSDDMGIRTGELSSLGDLRRMGFVEYAEGPFPAGPPSPTPFVITEAGRAALKQEAQP